MTNQEILVTAIRLVEDRWWDGHFPKEDEDGLCINQALSLAAGIGTTGIGMEITAIQERLAAHIPGQSRDVPVCRLTEFNDRNDKAAVLGLMRAELAR